jgi:hypothetical protein
MSHRRNARIHAKRRPTLASLAVAYDEQVGTDESFVIPEDLSVLTDEQLAATHAQAVEHFDALYGDGNGLTDDDMAALALLTDGVEALAAETAVRTAAQAERAEAAQALAARIGRQGTAAADPEVTDPEAPEQPQTEGGHETGADQVTGEDGDPADPEAPEDGAVDPAVTASAARREIRVPLSRARARGAAAAAQRPHVAPQNMTDVLVASGEGLGVAVGAGLDWAGAGTALNRRLQGFNETMYAGAARSGRAVREQHSLVQLRRDIPADLMIGSNDRDHVDSVFARAVDQSRLPGGSLVAAGGWCAPSETLYDLIELESRDGLFSIPEIGIARGGISFTPGPTFADIFADVKGFSYTEQQDIDGKYGVDANGIGDGSDGTKPVYTVECPEFDEYRLGVDGLAIKSGLLQQRGYPEVLARTLRGALIAHDHRLNGRLISRIAAGSTAVQMPAGQVGALSPLLTSIELQVEHYRYTHRLSRATVLEAVFPFWVRGAVRTDLSRQGGVDVQAITDAQITAWFALRGIAAQFVYNWQPIAGAASAFTAWPTSVSFLLYTAGTWIRGAGDLITVDTLYDSTLLENNDFIALFTEEGWFVAKRGHDSRVVNVPLDPTGATAAAVDIAANGTAVAA